MGEAAKKILLFAGQIHEFPISSVCIGNFGDSLLNSELTLFSMKIAIFELSKLSPKLN